MEEDYLPDALSIGMTYDEFMKSNPRKLDIYAKAFKIKQERKRDFMNMSAYIQGIYFGRVIASAMGNSKYPEKPLELFQEEKELTEEEIQKQTEAFFMSLQIMQSNFENSEKKKKSIQKGKE